MTIPNGSYFFEQRLYEMIRNGLNVLWRKRYVI
jgi:hypothetical protein